MTLYPMDDIFLQVLRLSWLTTILIGVVLLVRIPMGRLPKSFSYLLWLAVWFRAIMPIVPVSPLSLFNIPDVAAGTLQTRGAPQLPESQVSSLRLMDVPPDTSTFINRLETLPGLKPAEVASVDPIQIYAALGSFLWQFGMFLILAYTIFTYLRLLKSTKAAKQVDGRVHISDSIDAPFIIGFIRPKIMLPTGLSSDARRHVIAHETKHLSRGDHLIKPIIFAICVIHWFNPFMWLAFRLTVRDMEISCDEQAIRSFDGKERADYSETLLSFALRSNGVKSVLAFGESDVKRRIVSVLKFKEPKPWVIFIATLVTAIVLIMLVTTPKSHSQLNGIERNPQVNGGDGNPQVVKIMDATMEQLTGLYDFQRLYDSRTPYVGNNSKVASAVYSVPWPNGTETNGMALHTDQEPYGMTVHLIVKKGVDAETVYGMDGLTVVRANAATLFAVIDNLSYINITYKEEGTGLVGTVTPESGMDVLKIDRSEMEKRAGGELKTFGESPEALKELVLKMMAREDGNNLEGAKDPLRQDVDVLKDFSYQGPDLSTRVVYETYTDKMVKEYHDDQGDEFIVVAPTIYHVEEREEITRVFATVYGSRKLLDGNRVRELGGEVIPVAITYKKTDAGYEVTDFVKAKDGAYFNPSIKSFCTTPDTNKPIKGLYEQIMADYSNEGQDKRRTLMEENIRALLATERPGLQIEIE